jgi:geranylgeranyl diphosphate synthase, type II
VTQSELADYLQMQRTAIDRALDQSLKVYGGQTQAILKAMRYGLFPGGKRIRPILTLTVGEMFGAKQKELLPFACAVELIHAYSIIHDDLPAIDNDDLRRGEPTAHKVFGEGMALLAGDGLLTEAFHLISGPEVRRLPAELVLRLIHELSHAAGVAGLVGGQAVDLESESKDVDLATVEYIHVRKTGALILAAVRIGAQIAGAKTGDLRRVSKYGEYLGLAFQIADDVLDNLGETLADEGVESGHNERKKATYPSVVGIVQATERLQELLKLCDRELVSFGETGEPLRAIAKHIIARAIHDRGRAAEESIS